MKKKDEHIAVERAIDDLRRGLGFAVSGQEGDMLFVPAEFLDGDYFSAFASQPRRAVITGARAKHLRLTEEELPAATIDVSGLSLGQIAYLADPLAPKMELPKLSVKTADEADQLALALAKHASLLPALLKVESGNNRHWQTLTVGDMRYYVRNPVLEVAVAAEARLPLAIAEQSSIISFRAAGDASTHLALIVGDVAKVKTPLVRVHSSCVTGDILSSLRCDCGDQLKLALEIIAKEGAGILLYLHQEGRGIGITNKLRAYALQEQGIDTYTANRMLGFEEDERDFSIAAAILKKLGISQLRLLTNNPYKITSLKAHGLIITDRVELIAPGGKHSHAYLATKKKSGHLF